jgi:E3 SUMO-protein ligase PIAS1
LPLPPPAPYVRTPTPQIPCREHWPLHADLKINGRAYRVAGRSSASKLGANQRDEPASVGVLAAVGRNRVVLTCQDSRPFVIAVQLARVQGAADVRRLMRPALPLAAAVARVAKSIAPDDGDGGEEGGDSDVEVTHAAVSLRCPLTGGRIRTPARCSAVPGLAAFDLDAFLDVAARTRKWQCPHSMRPCPVNQLQARRRRRSARALCFSPAFRCAAAAVNLCPPAPLRRCRRRLRSCGRCRAP